MSAMVENGIIRVASKTPVDKLAGAIAAAVFDNTPDLCLRAIGHGAVGQAVKATAIARGIVAPRGIDLALIPGFEDIHDMPDGNGGVTTITAQVLRIIRR